MNKAATAEIIDWVCNDGPVHARLVKILNGEDRFRGRRASTAWGSGMPDADVLTGAMADFIEHLLTGATGSATYRVLYRRAADGGGYEPHVPKDVRANLDAFRVDVWMRYENGVRVNEDAMDWNEVRAAVLRGET